MGVIVNFKFQISNLNPFFYRVVVSIMFVAFFILFHLASVSFSSETPYSTARKPVFAGSFYPADKKQLEKKIDGFLKEAGAKSEKIHPHIFGIIAPHAGYDYSGQAAAYAYNQIKGKKYKTVIIIGPSHRVPFKGVAVYPSGAWETPFGNATIDEKVAKILMDSCKSIRTFPPAFEREHSLEVQLPFLQRTLKTFKIVPLATGVLGEEDFKNVSEILLKLVKQNPEEILIIASSDMSHFHSYNKANQMDKLALKYIEQLDIEKLFENMHKGNCELCGEAGIMLLMAVASKLNTAVNTLYYSNSGDVTNDKSKVVGYGSVVFAYQETNGSLLNRQEQNMLLLIARKTLDAYISKGSTPHFDIKEVRLLEKRGVFVTLKKHNELRGCIGYIMPVAPLYKSVIDMTISASTRDPRFPPVRQNELQNINIEISALTPLKLINDPSSIEIGKHGLYITRGKNSGLLLPQVATEYKWNREEFLRQTCVKAGLPRNAWEDKKTKIYSFAAQIFSE